MCYDPAHGEKGSNINYIFEERVPEGGEAMEKALSHRSSVVSPVETRGWH